MKPLNQRILSSWKEPVGLPALVAIFVSMLDGGAQEASDSAPRLIARPVEIEPTEILTQAVPQSAVAAVPEPSTVEEPEPVPDPPKAPADFRTEKSLGEFLHVGEGLAFKNATDVRSLRIPIPWRAKVPEMRVDLRYQNSAALFPGRSQMELWWNGGTVAQKPLDGAAADGRLLAEIPNRHLRPGAHPMEIRVLHQTSDACGDPFGENLWTQIDGAASSVTLSHQLRSLTPVLSDLPRLMDPYGWEPYRLRLVTAEPWSLTEIHLEWISRVVERSALMLETVPLEVTHGPVLSSTGDHIVIGLRDEIALVLPESITSEITESFMGIFPHPLDDRFFVTVISGSTREGIEKAVRVFAATEFILPPTPVVDLTNFSLPELPSGPPLAVFRAGEERSFAQLGFRTREWQGLSTERAGVAVHLPPGLTAETSGKLKLQLKMAWSPVRKDATVEILINDRRDATIPIGKAGAARLDDYEIELPLNLFHPGENRIAFQPNLIPPEFEDCKPVNWESLRFVLDDDSRMKLTGVDRKIELPDLRLTARSAIPAVNVGSAASPQPFTITMSDRGSVDLSAGCTILAKFFQMGGRRIPMSRLSFDSPAPDSNYLLVGMEDSLSRELIPPGADFRLKNSEKALVAQFESQLKEGRIGMAVAAATGRDISECARELIQPGRWDRLSGDTVTWGEAGDLLVVRPSQFRSVTVYHDADFKESGEGGFSAGWILYLLAGLLLAGGAVTFFLRRERRKSRLPGKVSIDAPMWSLRGEDRI